MLKRIFGEPKPGDRSLAGGRRETMLIFQVAPKRGTSASTQSPLVKPCKLKDRSPPVRAFRRVVTLGELDDVEVEIVVRAAVHARRHVDPRRAAFFGEEPHHPVVGQDPGIVSGDKRGKHCSIVR
jgi:hypothetical protein